LSVADEVVNELVVVEATVDGALDELVEAVDTVVERVVDEVEAVSAVVDESSVEFIVVAPVDVFPHVLGTTGANFSFLSIVILLQCPPTFTPR